MQANKSFTIFGIILMAMNWPVCWENNVSILLLLLQIYYCSLYSNSHFSLSMLSASAEKGKAITSKFENL